MKPQNICLLDVDSKIPNLALMRASTWHKQRGDNVKLGYEPLFQWVGGGFNGDAEKERPIQDMSPMRETTETKKDGKRKTGINARFQETKVLQQGVCVETSCWKNNNEISVMDDCTLPREEYLPTGTVCDMWEKRQDRCTSQERQLARQQARELNQSLQKLSLKRTQAESGLQDLRETTERIGVLRKALSEVQEIRESTDDSIRDSSLGGDCGGYIVRRLTTV